MIDVYLIQIQISFRVTATLESKCRVSGTPTWEEWLTKEEAGKTAKFIQGVRKHWDSVDRKPWLGSLDVDPRRERGEEEDGME